MKKIITLCLLLGFFNTVNALTIEEMSISPITGTNDINVYIRTSDTSMHSYYSENYTIIGGGNYN